MTKGFWFSKDEETARKCFVEAWDVTQELRKNERHQSRPSRIYLCDQAMRARGTKNLTTPLIVGFLIPVLFLWLRQFQGFPVHLSGSYNSVLDSDRALRSLLEV